MRFYFWLIALLALILPISCGSESDYQEWLISEAKAVIPSICPTGSSPRADIDFCVDFETATGCTTGQEAGCATNNGLDSLSTNGNLEEFRITTTCPVTPPTGGGCVYGSGLAGSTGPGYSDKAPAITSTYASLFYYVRFGTGYLQAPVPSANHGPGIKFGGGGCSAGAFVGVDFMNGDASWLMEGTCTGTVGGNVTNNIATWSPKPGKWYGVEMRVRMNTGTTGTGFRQGTGGLFEVLVDGVQVAYYTDLNINGSSTPVCNGAYLARSYYGMGVPSWKPNIYFDTFIYSNTGTTIGAPATLNSLGTADTKAYYNGCSYSGYIGSAQQPDCRQTNPGGNVTAQCIPGLDWRTVPTLQTSVAHGTYVNNCPLGSGPSTDKAMLSSPAAGGGSGTYNPLYADPSTYDRAVAHAWMRWDSGNSYATPVPTMGFARYSLTTNYDKYIAVCRLTNGNLGVCYMDNGSGTNTDTGIALSTDAWHEIELHIATGNKVSLFMDGSWYLSEATAAQNSYDWLTDTGSGGGRHQVFGVIHNPTASAFALYTDDSDTGPASFIDCRGWGTYCPFGTTNVRAVANKSGSKGKGR